MSDNEEPDESLQAGRNGGDNMDFTELNKQTDELRHLLQDAQRIVCGDFFYSIAKCANAYEMLSNRYAPFVVGDRVFLKSAPLIDDDHNPGWTGYKHILVVGARGVIKEVEVVMRDEPALCFAVAFDGYEKCTFFLRESYLAHDDVAKKKEPLSGWCDIDLAGLIGVRPGEDSLADSLHRYVSETHNAYGSLKSRCDAAEQELRRVRKALRKALSKG